MEKKQQKKSRWIIWIFLIVAIVGLAGVSFVPVFEELFSSRDPAQPVPTATATATPGGRQQELQDLEKSYLIVLEREPDNPNVLASLVETRLQMIPLGISKPNDLIEPLTKLSKLSPERTAYRVLLGQAQQQSGELAAASQTFRGILAEEAGNVEALQGLVTVLLREKRAAAAVDVLQTTLDTAKQANQIKPNTIDELAVKLILGQVYVEQKQSEQALALYDDLIKTSPKDFRPFYGKAVALRAQGNLEAAQTFFQSAAALAPEQYKAQIRATAQQSAPSQSPAPESSGNPAPNPATPEAGTSE